MLSIRWYWLYPSSWDPELHHLMKLFTRRLILRSSPAPSPSIRRRFRMTSSSVTAPMACAAAAARAEAAVGGGGQTPTMQPGKQSWRRRRRRSRPPSPTPESRRPAPRRRRRGTRAVRSPPGGAERPAGEVRGGWRWLGPRTPPSRPARAHRPPGRPRPAARIKREVTSTIPADEDSLVNRSEFLAYAPKKRSGKNVGAGRG